MKYAWIAKNKAAWPVTLTCDVLGVSTVADGGTHHPAALDTSQAQAPHQPLDGPARHLDALAVHLLPDLVGTIDLQVGVPDLFDLGHQRVVALRP